MREDLRSNLNVRRAINLCWMPYSAQDLLRRLYAYPAFLARFASEFSSEEQEILYRPKQEPFTPADVPLLDELAELLGEAPNTTSPTSRRSRSAAREPRSRDKDWETELSPLTCWPQAPLETLNSPP